MKKGDLVATGAKGGRWEHYNMNVCVGESWTTVVALARRARRLNTRRVTTTSSPRHAAVISTAKDTPKTTATE